jgi:exodeoxyribonuclease-5
MPPSEITAVPNLHDAEAPAAAAFAVQLDEGQQTALDTILARLKSGARRIVLAGAAGTGKTTVLLQIIERVVAAGWEVHLLAPTNKAARRMTETTGRPARTLHSVQYSKFVEADDGELVISGRRSFAEARELVVVDEASMLGSALVKDLEEMLPEKAAVLYLGDPYQLPPVKDSAGVDLDHPDAALTKVHRQAAENPILAYATAIREGWGVAWMQAWVQQIQAGAVHPSLQVVHADAAQIAAWAVGGAGGSATEGASSGSSDRQVLTWMHVDRQRINLESLRIASPGFSMRPGLKLVMRMNDKNRQFSNGDVFTVKECRLVATAPNAGAIISIVPVEKPNLSFLVAPRTFDVDEAWKDTLSRAAVGKTRYPIQKCTWGWCLTVHQSQGSQWDDVVLYLSREDLLWSIAPRSQNARLLYTAVTRAKKSLIIAVGG